MARDKCFLVLLLLLTITAAADHLCNSRDEAALLDIKKALGNPSLLSYWRPTPTAAAGNTSLVMQTPTGRVAGLHLMSNHQLAGRIASAVADLHHLGTLQLSDLPNIHGPIPPTITKLRRLQNLIVSGTTLSGTISPFLAQLNSLQYLGLSSNKLSGNVPAVLAALPNLTCSFATTASSLALMVAINPSLIDVKCELQIVICALQLDK